MPPKSPRGPNPLRVIEGGSRGAAKGKTPDLWVAGGKKISKMLGLLNEKIDFIVSSLADVESELQGAMRLSAIKSLEVKKSSNPLDAQVFVFRIKKSIEILGRKKALQESAIRELNSFLRKHSKDIPPLERAHILERIQRFKREIRDAEKKQELWERLVQEFSEKE